MIKQSGAFRSIQEVYQHSRRPRGPSFPSSKPSLLPIKPSLLPTKPSLLPSIKPSRLPSSHLSFSKQRLLPSSHLCPFQVLPGPSRSFQVLPGPSRSSCSPPVLKTVLAHLLSAFFSTIHHLTLSTSLPPPSPFRPCTALQWRRQPWVHGRRCSSSLHSSSPLSLDQFSHCWYQSSPSLDAASFTLPKVIPPSPFTLYLIKTTDVRADLASNRQRTARTNTAFQVLRRAQVCPARAERSCTVPLYGLMVEVVKSRDTRTDEL